MDAAFVESIVQLFERSALVELEFTAANGDRVSMSRRQPSTPHHEPALQASSAPLDKASVASVRHLVSASCAGAFHRGAGPDAPPFVDFGHAVAEGQALGLLEAMKVLNRIEADRAGRVVAILAQDGDFVEAGAALFALDPLTP